MLKKKKKINNQIVITNNNKIPIKNNNKNMKNIKKNSI